MFKVKRSILGSSGHTPILLVTHPSYWSHTHPTGHTPILLVTHPSYWSHIHPPGHTPILLVTHPSYWSHTHPTGHTPIIPVTHSSYWSHTHPTGHTSILLVTHPSYLSQTILLLSKTIIGLYICSRSEGQFWGQVSENIIFEQIKLEACAIPLFRGVLSGKIHL